MDIDVSGVLTSLATLVAAFALALPVAWHRERGPRHLGLRTLPLVAVASCGYALVGVQVAGGDPNALARLIQGLMTGIGFVGGGAILKQTDEVHGTATAAAIWATGAVGGAVGFDRYDLALSISGITFFTFLVLTPVEERLKDRGNGDG